MEPDTGRIEIRCRVQQLGIMSPEFSELKEKKFPGASRRYSLVIVARNQRMWWHKKPATDANCCFSWNRPAFRRNQNRQQIACGNSSIWRSRQGVSDTRSKRVDILKTNKSTAERRATATVHHDDGTIAKSQGNSGASGRRYLDGGETATWWEPFFQSNLKRGEKNEQVQPCQKNNYGPFFSGNHYRRIVVRVGMFRREPP